MAASLQPAGVMLDEASWRAAEGAHAVAVDSAVAGHVARRRRAQTHSVEDFLFTYYSHRPGRLRRWHAGLGVVLAGAGRDRGTWPGYHRVDADGVPAELGEHAAVDPQALGQRRDSLVATARLLDATAGRAAKFDCFGRHEWAMLYRATPEQMRHSGSPLRVSHAAVDEVVEAGPLRCTTTTRSASTPHSHDH